MSAVAEPAETEAAEYFSVSVNVFVPERCAGVRLYLADGGSQAMKLYRAETVPFEEKDRRRLAENGVRFLYVRHADQARFQAYLRENLPEVLADETVPLTQRLASLNEVVRDVLAAAFHGGNIDQTVQTSKDLAENCVAMLSREDVVAREVVRVLHHDYHTFTHSANVAFYCVLLANALGIRQPETLHEIAVGGFLHDLGKLDIPQWILNKPDRLTDQEYEIVQDHPRNGFLKLCHRTDLDLGQLMMAYHHHERIDGGGYPVGCSRAELHDWARICKVVDVFEAMTSDRPYRSGISIKDVLELMDRGSGKVFDEDMLKCWKTIIASGIDVC